MEVNRISCDPMCGFAVQSHDKKEVVSIASSHVKSVHNKSVPESELKAMMKPVSM